MDFHIIAPGRAPDLIARTGDGWLEIVPPAPEEQSNSMHNPKAVADQPTT